ncbi:hypothetical protein jhhlp_008813 [Lomentospora prolificans]|uniref:Heterokaryon incompatibility domain-containing protein n=1 Tax=Lomentospora prolificans TaxID=41688 RepID=A0A2N3MZ31_9PEZI|nr:hypothetical protein jhhlp_008813 [Lomentospora prolificans]
MAHIYTRALNTVIWVGESSDTTPEGMSLITEIRNFQDLPEPGLLQDVGLPALESPAWKGCWDILSRQWFTRLWTIQEAVLSSSPWVMCGEHIVEFSALSNVCAKLQKTPLGEALTQLYSTDDDLSRTVPVWHAAENIDNLKALRKTLGTKSLLTTLQLTRYSQSWDPRDKVYGMLSMARSETRVRVDYKPTNTAADVFYDTAVVDLDRDPACLVQLLTSVDHDPGSTADGLPSWVPDWHKQRATESLGFSTTSENVYNASAAEFKYTRGDFSHNPATRELMLQARIVGEISFLHKTCMDATLDIEAPAEKNSFLAEWIAKASSFAPTSERYGGKVLDTFWRTLVAGKDDSSMWTAPDSFAEIFSLIFDETTGGSQSEPSLPGQTYSPRQQRPRGKGRLELSNLRSRKPAETFAQIQTAMAVLKNRKLGYLESGHIGLFPRYARVGDLVCVFRGFHVPFVIRLREDGRYTFLAECYLHGIMNGEIMKSEEIKEEPVALV